MWAWTGAPPRLPSWQMTGLTSEIPSDTFHVRRQGVRWTFTPAGHAAEQPGTWCWILASSQPATTSRGVTTRAPTRYTRCRCGCVHRAAWPSLLADPTVPEEPRGTEPAALVAQAADAVARVAAAGLLAGRRRGARVRQPARRILAGPARGPRAGAVRPRRPGGRDRRLLRHDARGRPACGPGRAGGAARTGRRTAAAVPRAEHDHRQRPVERAAARALCVLLDHRADRHAGRGRLAARARLGGSSSMAVPCCWPRPEMATGRASRTPSSESLVAEDARVGVRDPGAFARLQRDVRVHAQAVHDWLAMQRAAGTTSPRLRGRVPGGRIAVPGACGSHPLACGHRRLAGQARPADARNRHPRGSPGRACGDAARPRCCCSCRTCWPRFARPTQRWKAQAAGGLTSKHWAHEACSRTRSRARHRPRVGPMLPIGSPS